MKKFAIGSFALLTVVIASYAAPISFRHSQPVKPTVTAVIPPPSCPANDPNGCGILD